MKLRELSSYIDTAKKTTKIRRGCHFDILRDYFPFGGSHVERSEDTKKGEGPETPREPSEPGDVS